MTSQTNIGLKDPRTGLSLLFIALLVVAGVAHFANMGAFSALWFMVRSSPYYLLYGVALAVVAVALKLRGLKENTRTTLAILGVVLLVIAVAWQAFAYYELVPG